MAHDSARLIAAELLAGVMLDGSYANLLLPRLLAESSLSVQDRALATELSYGTLRMQGSLDQILQHLSTRPLEELDPEVLIALRLGSYQLLATRIPHHAAVDESVKLIRVMRRASASSFVNAMLRRVADRDFAEWAVLLHPDASTDAYLSFTRFHPEWIIRAFRESLAGNGISEEHELEALLEADNAAPQVNVAVLPTATAADRLAIEAASLPLPYSPYARVLESGMPGRFSSIRQGRIRVQDQGSQLAALALISAAPLKAGEQWADFCAGPGGKAALLASVAGQHDIHFLANELNPVRARLVEQAVHAVNPDAELRVGDGRDFHSAERLFDRIMLDAPCSGIGALRRRPEARWQKTPRDIATLIPLQQQLLDSAIRSLRPGGIVAYVTCSPHLAETHQVVQHALQQHPTMIALPTAELLNAAINEPLTPFGAEKPQLQLWPHLHGTDAMFITLLQAPVVSQ